MANFVFIPSEASLNQYADFRVASIDGLQAQTLKSFYEQIAKELEFPDYFGHNLDSLDELLNDFDWLDDDKIALYIANADHFLAGEKSEEKKADLLNILDAAAEDWKWVDDEAEEVTPRQFVILLQQSNGIQSLMDREGFAYDVVA